ncbi:MAG: UvrD-helicase domain-containing protein [Peptococcaceae bacterium]|nr:UvrD-helicase domain-containing protein [Peptococcaceae bacterium]
MYDLNDLNPAQREAVELMEGPLLLLAGAGSGKTRVLTHRVAHMIGQGIDPWSILAITFTNKAAAEMRERITSLVRSEGKGLWVGTFHAVCMRILRMEVEKLAGYGRSFVIFDTADQMALLRAVLKELNIDEKRFAPRALLAAISNAKNKLWSVSDFELQAGDFFEKMAARVYGAYQEKLFANNAMDFDDIIMLTVRLFREYPQVLGYYQNRFRYILVDEYQDTNHAQYVLINLLAERYRNLCVVGDDDQSVYGWRGADIQNILEFERDYPEAAVLKLEQNYRSSGSILAVANAIVRHNRGRKEKALWTQKGDGERVAVHRAADDVEEARFVVDQVLGLRDELGLNYGDFAVLYRTNAQSRGLEERFVRAGAPYRVYSGVKFYERMEIKDILAYLRFIYNPTDMVSFRRVVNVPRRGIGDTSVQKVLEYVEGRGSGSGYEEGMGAGSGSGVRTHGVSGTGTGEQILFLELLASPPEDMGLQARAVKALKGFAELVQSLREAAETGGTLTGLTRMVLEESGYWEALKADGTPEGEARLENLEEFLNVTAEFDEHAAEYLEDLELDPEQNLVLLGGFLERVALVADIDAYEDGEDVVKFMTIHSAKGLEFPVVFIVGMEEGIFPSSRSVMEPALLEEERRLCYVAVTRAKERVFLLHARRRMRFGRTEPGVPSRFLEEIPARLKDEDKDKGYKSSQSSRLSRSRDRIGEGGTGSSGSEGKTVGDWRSRGTPVAPVAAGAFGSEGSGGSSGAAGALRSGGSPGAAGSMESESRGQDLPQMAYHVGDRVIHPSFGQGIVMSCRNEGGEDVVTVVFAGEIKKLIVAYARLEKV